MNVQLVHRLLDSDLTVALQVAQQHAVRSGNTAYQALMSRRAARASSEPERRYQSASPPTGPSAGSSGSGKTTVGGTPLAIPRPVTFAASLSGPYPSRPQLLPHTPPN